MSWTDAHGTFAIVGAQKAGTTALSQFLAAHPGVCMAEPAETHFFDRSQYFTGCPPPYREFHRAVYQHYGGEQAVGWSTPSIMFAHGAVERLARYNRDLRLIVLLRHPVERAFSHYRMQVAAGHEQLTFRRALESEPGRLAAGTDFGEPGLLYSYASRGLYEPQIQRLIRHFGCDQILFVESERLRLRHQETLAEVYRFVGVSEPAEFPASRQVHVGSDDRLTDEDRAALLRLYRETVNEVERLLGWSLPEWRR